MDKKLVAQTFMEIADALENNSVIGERIKIGITNMGSEHGADNINRACDLAKSDLFDIVIIGEKYKDYECYECATEDEMYKKMEELLDNGTINACVTLHYNFPLGVSTVGRVITPGFGKEMFIANTTGMSSPDRVEQMIRNALCGIIAAKSCGVEKPTVGILNVEGAKTVEKALKQLKENGFDIEFAESARADGGIAMRGNDLLMGTADVMVCDSLTGNLLMKMFSSFNSGGSYETLGYGYGPGIGEGFDRNIFIISRASGSPVIANALKYAYDTCKHNIQAINKEVYKVAKKAKLTDVIPKKQAKQESSDEVKMPAKELVEATVSGIDILEIEDAVKALWKENIYAESGMGCTGPIVQISDANKAKAEEILRKNNFIE